MPLEPCHIIGVLDNGPAGMTREALEYISEADLLVGVPRTFGLFGEHLKPEAEKHNMTGRLLALPDVIRGAQESGRKVVVLATGDPLCHGIAGFLQSRLCIEAVEVIPNLSMVQLACARLGMPWQGLKICSIHGRDVGEWPGHEGFKHGLFPLLQALQIHDQLAVYTGPDNSPARIARMMMAENMADDFHMAVAERLTRDDEKLITDMAVSDATQHRFADPNIVMLWRKEPRQIPMLFGLEDELFKQRKPDKGLITKREIRAVSLAHMQLTTRSIVWDIGAGSGAVGLEAARLAADGFVHAIEKNEADAAIAQKNKQRLKLHNYRLYFGKAPAGLDDWPDPNAVFIGGSGGHLEDLIKLCLARLKPGGALVMNFITLENLNTATQTLKAMDMQWDVTQMQISRSRPILHMNRLAAENPVWIVSAEKENT